MSLLIKGMSMPKSCKDCLCREYPKFSFESDWCCLNQKTISDVKVISPNCPLVNVPTPHGRLIDADKAATSISMMNNHPCGNSIETVNDVVEWLRFADENSNNIAFPTIIEAEVN